MGKTNLLINNLFKLRKTFRTSQKFNRIISKNPHFQNGSESTTVITKKESGTG